MIGCAKRDHWDLVKYIFSSRFTWLMISIGAGIATFQLFFKPHYWEKTIHGLHLQNEIALQDGVPWKLQTQNARAQRIRKLIDLASSDWARGRIIDRARPCLQISLTFSTTYLGRTINVEDSALSVLIGSFTYISQIPLAAVSGTATFRSAYFLGKYEAPIKQYWAYLRRQTMPFGHRRHAYLAYLSYAIFPRISYTEHRTVTYRHAALDRIPWRIVKQRISQRESEV